MMCSRLLHARACLSVHSTTMVGGTEGVATQLVIPPVVAVAWCVRMPRLLLAVLELERGGVP